MFPPKSQHQDKTKKPIEIPMTQFYPQFEAHLADKNVSGQRHYQSFKVLNYLTTCADFVPLRRATFTELRRHLRSQRVSNQSIISYSYSISFQLTFDPCRLLYYFCIDFSQSMPFQRKVTSTRDTLWWQTCRSAPLKLSARQNSIVSHTRFVSIDVLTIIDYCGLEMRAADQVDDACLMYVVKTSDHDSTT